VENGHGFAPETASKMRSELNLAIQTPPGFPSRIVSGLCNLVTNTQLDESLEMLKRALAASPQERSRFMMRKIYCARRFQNSAQLIDNLMQHNDNESVSGPACWPSCLSRAANGRHKPARDAELQLRARAPLRGFRQTNRSRSMILRRRCESH